MVKHEMLRVITGSNFHKLRFPGVFCSFLLPDHLKEKQRIRDEYNTIEDNFLVFFSVHLISLKLSPHGKIF